METEGVYRTDYGNEYVDMVEEWIDLDKRLRLKKLELKQLGIDVVEKLRSDLKEINHPDIYRSHHPFARVGKVVNIPAPYVKRLSEGTLNDGARPLSIAETKLLIEIAKVGIDIMDDKKYKVNRETHEFEKLDQDENNILRC